MFYTQESYEKMERLLKTVCVVPSSQGQSYEILKYKAETFFIASNTRKRYLVSGRYFEIDPPRISTGAGVERRITVKFSIFTSDKAFETPDTEEEATARRRGDIEFMVGALEIDGKKAGSLFAFSDAGTFYAVKAVLRKFVAIQVLGSAEEDFERSLLQMLRTSGLL
jgi:hypothetical protein